MYYVWNLFGIIVLQFVSHLLSGSMVGLMVNSSKKAYATHCVTQVCCTQSSCPCCRPLVTHTSAGDTQKLKGRSGWVSVGSLGPDTHKALFEPSKHLWRVWGLILNMILPFLLSFWGFFFALGFWGIFFAGIQHSPVDDCSAVSCNFGVLAGEDVHTSIYSAILSKECDLGLN